MITRILLALLVSNAHARLIVYALADAFLDDRGEVYEWLDDPYTIRVDEVGHRFLLCGFGMKNERVRPVLSPRFRQPRNLVFLSDDPKSTRRPRLVVSAKGFAVLHTRALTSGRLSLGAISEVQHDFAAETLETNARGLALSGWWRRERCERALH